MTGENHAKGHFYFQIRNENVQNIWLPKARVGTGRYVITYSRHRHTNHKRGGQTHHFLGLAVGCPEFSLSFFLSFGCVGLRDTHNTIVNTCRLFTVRGLELRLVTDTQSDSVPFGRNKKTIARGKKV